MFLRFNSGAALLEKHTQIFNGIFTLIIKDVPDLDIETLHKEFLEKIQDLIKKYGNNNFIYKLYKKNFSIFPFSCLEKPKYY